MTSNLNRSAKFDALNLASLAYDLRFVSLGKFKSLRSNFYAKFKLACFKDKFELGGRDGDEFSSKSRLVFKTVYISD